MANQKLDIPTNNAEYDFKDEDVSVFKTPKGINEEIVREISAIKNEPEWMLEYRLKSLKCFLEKPMPTWQISKLPHYFFINSFINSSSFNIP